jgi:putative Mn2+ efflux pump MntP
MDLGMSVFVAFGLAMDAFAVSLGASTGGQVNDRRSKFRLAFHFGIFQAGMTLLGWATGTTITKCIAHLDHWVALGLLSYVGIGMIHSGLTPGIGIRRSNPSKGGTLVMLCIATSLDALAVGISLAMLSSSILSPAAIIGIVTFLLSGAGLLAGGRLSEKFGARMEILGGLILLGIGLRLLIADLYL